MRILVTLFLFYVISCGNTIPEDFVIEKATSKSKDPRIFKSIDDRLLIYVMEFEIYYRKEITIPIGIKKVVNISKNKNRRTIGKCITWNTGHKEIYIDEKFYEENKDDYYTIQFVIFHELGHCILNRDHDNSKINKNGSLIEKSIMNSKVFGNNSYYKLFESYYINELFKGN